MNRPDQRFETVSIIRYGNGKYKEHRVGGPSRITESATRREIIYAQNDSTHRTGAPAYYLINKASGVAVEEIWYQRGRKSDREDGPHTTLRDPATGGITEQRTGWHPDGKRTQGPWHIDPDYLAKPDKPQPSKQEVELHTRGLVATSREGFEMQTIHREVQHREGNLPSRTHTDGGGVRQEYRLNGVPARTDGGPNSVGTFPVWVPGSNRGVFGQSWQQGFQMKGHGYQEGPRRENGPSQILLRADGAIVEKWNEPQPAHAQMKWARTKIEQGGPLWVPPEQRYPDGPNGPSQILIHPDSGVRWYEARYNAAGQLDRDDGPAQVIRDQQTGKPLFVAHKKDGELHRQGGPALQIFEAKTGAPLMEKWASNGHPYEPTAEQRLQWEASQRAQTQRPGGVKAAAAAAAAKNATPKVKAADRGDER
jgi:hypothetical protein